MTASNRAGERGCDPQIAAFLAQRAAVLGGSFGEMTPEAARRAFDDVTAWNRGKSEFPPPVGQVRDLLVAGPAGEIPVRAYLPTTGRHGLVVFFHGGGFVFGSIDSHDEIARILSERSNLTVLSVEYPLAPEHPHPAATEAGVACARWAVDNAHRLFGARPDSIVLAGDSAGGAIAASVALHPAARELGLAGLALCYAPLVPADRTDEVGVVPWSERDQTYGPSRASTDFYWGSYLANTDADGDLGGAAPLLAADLSRLPPTLVVAAGLDTYHCECIALARRAEAAGVRTWLLDFPRINHGFLVHGWLPRGLRSEAAFAATLEVCAALNRLARSRLTPEMS